MPVITSTHTATGRGQPFKPSTEMFNLSLQGTFVGTAQIERSFDAGSTWQPVTVDTAGSAAAFSSPVSFQIADPEAGGVLYCWNVTAYTSGTMVGRFGP